MEEMVNTRAVAECLGVSFSRLSRAVWLGQVKPPHKSPGGDFLWTRKDIEGACWVLLHRDLDAVLAERTEGCR